LSEEKGNNCLEVYAGKRRIPDLYTCMHAGSRSAICGQHVNVGNVGGEIGMSSAYFQGSQRWELRPGKAAVEK